MTIENSGSFQEKHPPDTKVNAEIAAALKQGAPGGELPCAVAFKIASDLETTPSQVGLTADLLQMPLVKCQMGLFGYTPKKSIIRPAKEVPESLRAAIMASLTDGKLTCATAWEISTKLSIHKMQVASACEALGIKITSCQLGAF